MAEVKWQARRVSDGVLVDVTGDTDGTPATAPTPNALMVGEGGNIPDPSTGDDGDVPTVAAGAYELAPGTVARIFVSPTDPGAVGAGAIWVNSEISFANVYPSFVRDPDDTFWLQISIGDSLVGGLATTAWGTYDGDDEQISGHNVGSTSISIEKFSPGGVVPSSILEVKDESAQLAHEEAGGVVAAFLATATGPAIQDAGMDTGGEGELFQADGAGTAAWTPATATGAGAPTVFEGNLYIDTSDSDALYVWASGVYHGPYVVIPTL